MKGNVGENIREMQREKIRLALEEKRKLGRNIKKATRKGFASGMSCGEKCLTGLRNLSKKWFTHVFLLTVLFGYAALGAAVFSILEGTVEEPELPNFNASQLRVNTLEALWNLSRHGKDWGGDAMTQLNKFEEGIKTLVKYQDYVPPKEKWSFWQSMFFCGTVFTTIGYGNLSPATTAGRIATIIYAAIGIPLTLMVLVDIGKLFTRAIKFLFKFIRRFYYTGSCRRVRKSMPVEAMTKAFHSATSATERAIERIKDRSPSIDLLSSTEEGRRKAKSHDKLTPKSSEEWNTPAASPSIPPRIRKSPITGKDSIKSSEFGDDNWSATSVPGSIPLAFSDSTPSLPTGHKEDVKFSEDDDEQLPDAFVVDDEFNLPVSIALLLLCGYIMLGAFLFTFWEDWDVFESFYFIFISISTIGFGDYLPEHPMFMLSSFIYLLFGLALTSMCINVTQEALASTLNDAKVKLGARMGLEISDVMDIDDNESNKPKVEVAGVHNLEVQPTPPPRQKRKRSAVPDDFDKESIYETDF